MLAPTVDEPGVEEQILAPKEDFAPNRISKFQFKLKETLQLSLQFVHVFLWELSV